LLARLQTYSIREEGLNSKIRQTLSAQPARSRTKHSTMVAQVLLLFLLNAFPNASALQHYSSETVDLQLSDPLSIAPSTSEYPSSSSPSSPSSAVDEPPTESGDLKSVVTSLVGANNSKPIETGNKGLLTNSIGGNSSILSESGDSSRNSSSSSSSSSATTTTTNTDNAKPLEAPEDGDDDAEYESDEEDGWESIILSHVHPNTSTKTGKGASVTEVVKNGVVLNSKSNAGVAKPAGAAEGEGSAKSSDVFSLAWEKAGPKIQHVLSYLSLSSSSSPLAAEESSSIDKTLTITRAAWVTLFCTLLALPLARSLLERTSILEQRSSSAIFATFMNKLASHKQDKGYTNILKGLVYLIAIPFVFPAAISVVREMMYKDLSEDHIRMLEHSEISYMLLFAFFVYDMILYPIRLSGNTREVRNTIVQHLHHLTYCSLLIPAAYGGLNVYDYQVLPPFVTVTCLGTFPIGFILVYYYFGEDPNLKSLLLLIAAYLYMIANMIRMAVSLTVYGYNFNRMNTWFKIVFPISCAIWSLDQVNTYAALMSIREKTMTDTIRPSDQSVSVATTDAKERKLGDGDSSSASTASKNKQESTYSSLKDQLTAKDGNSSD